MARRTKIVATVGPASDDPTALKSLLDAGVDTARIGLAHGSIDDHKARIAAIRATAAELARPVAVLADLPGPKIRTTAFPSGGVHLVEGALLDLVPGHEPSTAERVNVCYPTLLDDLLPGDSVALGDGALVLHIEEREPDRFVARVISAGRVQGRPGAHLPSERLRVSTPTAQDFELIAALAPLVDYLAISFVRTAADVSAARDAVVRAMGPRSPIVGPKLVAKIETRAAFQKLEEIVEMADAIMVARGDLGVECPIEEVPHLQKQIVRLCVSWGVPVITATQMLESMIHSPVPTRAEASDVANAVFDGTDAVMLSAETAIGHNPPLTVRTMGRILARAEQEANYAAWGGRLGRLQSRNEVSAEVAISGAMSHAAWRVATEVDATAIIVCTRSGYTARAMARFRPPCPLVCFSPSDAVVRQLSLSWGVDPHSIGWFDTSDAIIWHAVEVAVQRGLVRPGETVVVLAGAPPEDLPTSDVLRVVRVR
jgi:pyruvate kinase